MSLPNYQKFMLPVLEALADGDEATQAHICEEICEKLVESGEFTSDDMEEKLSRGETVLSNRIGWALLGLHRAVLIERARRGIYRITPSGTQLLSEKPDQINVRFLRKKFPAFEEWWQGTRQGAQTAKGDTNTERDPDDELKKIIEKRERILEHELLTRLCGEDMTPSEFEQVVLDLLTAMGYGGGKPEWAEKTGGAGDGGIDGVIREDVLGINKVYIQVKKYANDIGPGMIREFLGALSSKGISKGVFVTTSGFSPSAKDIVRTNQNIILIDGKKFAGYMREYDVGCKKSQTHVVKTIDESYFENN